jgi:hypothetical protein
LVIFCYFFSLKRETYYKNIFYIYIYNHKYLKTNFFIIITFIFKMNENMSKNDMISKPRMNMKYLNENNNESMSDYTL